MAGINVPITATWNGQALKTAETQMNGFKKSFTKSFAGMGAALGGAFALGTVVDQLQQMAKAASDDQTSMVALKQALDNIGLGYQAGNAEAFVSALSKSSAVADDTLRPALQRLTTATGNLDLAQRGLKTAVDLNRAGYGDVNAMAMALSKGLSGNFTALKRLGVPLDETAVRMKDVEGVLAGLNRQFGGQSAAYMKTYAGQLESLTVAAGEAQEIVGYALLDAISGVSEALGGPSGANAAMEWAAKYLAEIVRNVGDIATGISYVGKAIADVIPQIEGFDLMKIVGGPTVILIDNVAKAVNGLAAAIGYLTGDFEAAEAAMRRMQGFTEITKGTIRDSGAAISAYDTATKDAAGSSEDLADNITAVGKAASSSMTDIDKLKVSIDILTGKRKSIREGWVALGEDKRNLSELGGKVWVGKGKNRRQVPVKFMPQLNANGGLALGTATGGKGSQWAQDYSDDTLNQVSALVAAGRADDAMKLLRESRGFLRGVGRQWNLGNPAGFARAYLPTPPVLAGIIRDQAAAGRTPSNYTGYSVKGAGSESIVNTYYFTGDLNVSSIGEAVKVANQAARLRHLNGGRNVRPEILLGAGAV